MEIVLAHSHPTFPIFSSDILELGRKLGDRASLKGGNENLGVWRDERRGADLDGLYS